MKRKHALPLFTIAVISVILGALAVTFSPAWVTVLLIKPSLYDGLYQKAAENITRKVMREVFKVNHAST